MRRDCRAATGRGVNLKENDKYLIEEGEGTRSKHRKCIGFEDQGEGCGLYGWKSIFIGGWIKTISRPGVIDIRHTGHPTKGRLLIPPVHEESRTD